MDKIETKEEEIETIYIDDNRETHFDSVKDSIKIYKVIFKQFFSFITSSLFSSFIDILSFYIIFKYFLFDFTISEKIIIATIIARITSSLINYTINHKIVFKSEENHKITLLKYYILCLAQMACSALLVTYFSHLIGGEPTSIKIFVDLFLFFVSYQLQKKIIFKGRKL